jgi:hypothetical protein
MRWLLIVLLVSLAGLLIAAAGMALHIRMQRSRLRSRPPEGAGPASDRTDEIEEETEI